MRKIMAAVLMGLLLFSATGCSEKGIWFVADQDIVVISREDGSGTRGAFIELFDLEYKTENTRKDLTTKEAIISNKTGVVAINVANVQNAIGYLSLSSLDGTIKALDVDGVSPTVENVKNGSYDISRPFNIATKGEPDGLAKDFISFILSEQGQNIVNGNNFISVDDSAPLYEGGNASGSITVGGSSSVTPVMEKLKEAYVEINPNASIEIQMSDSTSGMTGAIDGSCDIGMSSRNLKDSELEQLTPTVIALDGIAIIANNANPISNITSEQVKGVFMGEITKWNEIIE